MLFWVSYKRFDFHTYQNSYIITFGNYFIQACTLTPFMIFRNRGSDTGMNIHFYFTLVLSTKIRH